MYLALRIVAQNVFLAHKQSILEVLYFYILFIFLL